MLVRATPKVSVTVYVSEPRSAGPLRRFLEAQGAIRQNYRREPGWIPYRDTVTHGTSHWPSASDEVPQRSPGEVGVTAYYDLITGKILVGPHRCLGELPVDVALAAVQKRPSRTAFPEAEVERVHEPGMDMGIGR